MSCEISDMHAVRSRVDKEHAINYTYDCVIHFEDMWVHFAGNVQECKVKSDKNASKQVVVEGSCHDQRFQTEKYKEDQMYDNECLSSSVSKFLLNT